MISEIKKQDLFNKENQIIGHGCNCLGGMGAGIAKVFKDLYPANYIAYRKLCKETKTFLPGGVFVSVEGDGRVIANLATQYYLGADARLEWIESSLTKFESLGYKSIALPWVGCGIGGLKREDVKKIFENSSLQIKVCEL